MLVIALLVLDYLIYFVIANTQACILRFLSKPRSLELTSSVSKLNTREGEVSDCDCDCDCFTFLLFR